MKISSRRVDGVLGVWKQVWRSEGRSGKTRRGCPGFVMNASDQSRLASSPASVCLNLYLSLDRSVNQRVNPTLRQLMRLNWLNDFGCLRMRSAEVWVLVRMDGWRV